MTLIRSGKCASKIRGYSHNAPRVQSSTLKRLALITAAPFSDIVPANNRTASFRQAKMLEVDDGRLSAD